MFCLCLARVEFLLVSSVTLTLTVSAGEPPLTLGLWESSRSSTLESRTFQRLLLASPDQASLLEPAAMSLFTLLMADDVDLQLPLRLSVADFILDLANLSISTYWRPAEASPLRPSQLAPGCPPPWRAPPCSWWCPCNTDTLNRGQFRSC